VIAPVRVATLLTGTDKVIVLSVDAVICPCASYLMSVNLIVPPFAFAVVAVAAYEVLAVISVCECSIVIFPLALLASVIPFAPAN